MVEYPRINVETVTGVRLLPIKGPRKPGGPLPEKPYGVMWDAPGETPARPSAYFASIELLERKIVELNEAKRKGRISLVPTADELTEWRAFKSKIGTMSPLDVWAEYCSMREKLGKSSAQIQVDKAVDDYLAHEKKRLGEGEPDPLTKRRKGQTLGDDSYRQRRCKLLRFKEEFGLAMLGEVTRPEVIDWADHVPEVNSAQSWNDHIKQVRALYYHYEEQVPNNPAAGIKLRDDYKDTVRVLPVADIAKLLRWTRDTRPWLMPRLACEVFAGVRFTGAAKLRKEHIRIDSRTLILPRWLVKTRSDHSLQIMPEAFWAWVRIGHDDQRCWDMSVSDYMHAKSAIFQGAGVVNPGNALRHTMPSRHVAAFSDPGLIARILCHKNQQKLWDTYLGQSSQDDGIQHFRLRPENVERAAAGEYLDDPDSPKAPAAKKRRA